MASRNADQQRRYRQRQRERERERDLVHVQGWVAPDQAEAIRRIMAERSGRGVAPRAEQRAEQNDPESP
jgi:hypothetical protein